jgi:hypothetical protein
MFCTQRYSSTLLEVSMETHENDDMVVIWQSFTTCDRPTRWVRKIIQAGETDRTRQPQKSRGCRTLYVPLSQTNQERERESPISLHCVSTRAMRYGTLERRKERQAMKAILVLKLQLLLSIWLNRIHFIFKPICAGWRTTYRDHSDSKCALGLVVR